jgi:starvation-inducible DNA-binding protein
MAKTQSKDKTPERVSAQPRLHQRTNEIQAYGTVSHLLPLDLEEPVRLEMSAQLNQLLADTMTLRDLYKKSHWQVAGPTFYQLHLLFDRHFIKQVELVDSIAERIQLLGGVSFAMAPDVADTTRIDRPPRGSRRGSHSAITPFRCPPDHHSSNPRAGTARCRNWRRWHQ